MLRWFFVVIYLFGALVCAVEGAHLLSWDTVAVRVSTAEVARCGEFNDDICSRVEYDYEVDGVAYHKTALRPFFDTANDATFWRAYQAAASGVTIAGYVSPYYRYQSALNRFPGPLFVGVMYLLTGITLICLTGRRMRNKLAPYLKELLARKQRRPAGKAGRFRLVKVAIFAIGTLSLALLPALEGKIYPWTRERMQVVSMTPTDGLKDHCMNIVMAPASDASIAPGMPKRSMRSCNSDGLFRFLASMQLKEPLDLHIRKSAGKDEVRLAPHVTSSYVRWSTWYALLLILLI